MTNPLRRLARLVRRERPGPAILMYHRVVEAAHDPWGMIVSPDNFAAQLDAMTRERTVLPAAEFIPALFERRLPRDAVLVTFDDGYRDNLHHAAPALAAAGVEAVLFLATGPVRTGRAYWFEELSAMILDAPGPVRVELALPGGAWAIDVGEREPADEHRAGWRAWEAPRTRREAAYAATWDRLRRLPPRENDAAMAALRAMLPASLRPADGPMSPAELTQLVGTGAFVLGGHTIDHPDLTEMDDAGVSAQVETGRDEALAFAAGAAANGFAYPYGMMDARVRDLVAASRFDWACTTRHGYVGTRRDDRFALPRVTAEDAPGISWLG